MAVLGSATIVVRAITTGVKDDLKKTFDSVAKDAEAAGKRVGDSYNKGMRSRTKKTGGILDDVTRGLKNLQRSSKGAISDLNMIESGFINLGTVLTQVIGGVAALGSALVSLVGVLGAVAASSVAAVGALASLGAGAVAAKFALGGVGAAVSQATQANTGLGKSIKDIREELQQLAFDAEQAALSEKEAALNLEKARNNLARVQDLPPNSMARREAELQYEQAELAFRRAKDRAADLKDQTEEGISDPAAAGNDPYANLTKSQKEFAKRLVALKPILDSLKEELAKGFLPALGDGIEEVVGLLDGRLRPSLGRLGDSLGIASGNFFDQITNDRTVTLFERFVDKSGPRIESFGEIFGNLFGAFLGLLDAAAPLIDRFVGFLDDSAESLNKFFSGGSDDQKLVDFFERVGDTAADVGEIFGNLFGGLGVLIETTTGPGSGGQYLLDWFKEITAGFKNMGPDEKSELKQFFLDSAVNAQKFLQLLGDIFGIFGDIGADPRLGDTFDKLREATPFVQEIVDAFVGAGPMLAQIFVDLSAIAAGLLDEDGVSSFFTTIQEVTGRIREFVESEGFQDFIDRFAPIIATASALGFLFVKLKPIFLAASQAAFLLINPIANFFGLLTGTGARGGIAGAIGGFKDLIKQPGGFMKALKGAGIIGLIILIVSKIIQFYTQFEDFKATVDSTLEGVGEAFGGLFESLGGLFDNLFGDEGLGGLMEALDPILKFLLEIIIPAVGMVISTVIDSLAVVIDFISSIVGSIFDSIGMVIEGILDLFQGNFKEGLGKIVGGIGIFILGVIQAAVNGIISLINMAIGAIENLIRGLADNPIAGWIAERFGVDLRTVKLQKVALVDWTGQARANLNRNLNSANSVTSVPSSGLPNPSRLAEGGVVQATAGGVLAIIGEGGRNERVEPLDPQGLSERDKAIISAMAGPRQAPTINVYPSEGMDEKELAKLVSREIAFMTRRGNF